MTERSLAESQETLKERPKVAIAGASGRFGSRLAQLLQGDLNLTLLTHENPAPQIEEDHRTIDRFDISDYESTRRTIMQLAENGTKILINAAGDISVDNSESTRMDHNSKMAQVNWSGAGRLARLCKEEGLGLIHLSTEYVFKGDKPFGEKYSEHEAPYISDDSPTWYGQTKAFGDHAVRDTYNEGAVIVRLPQVQAPTWGLFAATLRAIKKGEPFTRANNQMVSALTDEVATNAIFQIIKKLKRAEELYSVYHVSATDTYTSYQTSLMLADAFGLGEKARQLITPVTLEHLVETGEQKVIRPKNSILDVSRFENEFPGILQPVSDEIQHFKNLYGYRF